MLETNKIYVYIGSQVKHYRNTLNLNQEDLAKNSGLTRTSIVHIEKGEQKVPIDKLYKIAKALKRTIHDFLPENEEIFETFDDISKRRISKEEEKVLLDKLLKKE